eukprot:181315-Hanusia_phi.AAC.1
MSANRPLSAQLQKKLTYCHAFSIQELTQHMQKDRSCVNESSPESAWFKQSYLRAVMRFPSKMQR